MSIQEKIKVFISSKCINGNLNYDDLVNDPSIDKAILAGMAIKESYSLVRNALKIRLEETGFIKVYLFEDDGASTFTASADFINELDDSHVCIFLLDNFDNELSEGLQKEITRAEKTNKLSIFLFLNRPNYEKTSIQKRLEGGTGVHWKAITDIKEFLDYGYRSIIDDIVCVYKLYAKGKLVAMSEESTPIEREIESFPLEVVDVNKQIFTNLGLTKNKLISLIDETNNNDVSTSEIDKQCLNILEILLGEKTLFNKEIPVILKLLREIQCEQLFEIVTERWKAVSQFYCGQIDESVDRLEKLYERCSKESTVSKWIVNDILIDLGNIKNIQNQVNDVVEFSVAGKLNQQDTVIFFPLIDRFDKNLSDDLWETDFKSLTDSPYTWSINNIDSQFGLISNYLFTAIYYGSYTHLIFTLRQLIKVILNLAINERNLLYDLQLMRLSILVGDENKFTRIMSKFKSALSHCTSKEITDLYYLAEIKPLVFQKIYWKMLIFKEIGAYLPEENLRTISSEIFDYCQKIIHSERPNHNLLHKLIDALEYNVRLLPQEEIISIITKIIEIDKYRFTVQVIKILNKIDFSGISNAKISDLLHLIYFQLKNQNTSQRIAEFEYFFIKIRKNRDDFAELIDEIVKNIYPDFFVGNYDLEVFPQNKEKHLWKYLESISARNNAIKMTGRFYDFGYYPYVIIKNIIEKSSIELSEDLFMKLIEEIKQTILSDFHEYSEKINAIQLALCLKRQVHSIDYDWKNFYVFFNQNFTKIENGQQDLFHQDSALILKLNMIIVQIELGGSYIQELFEILALINNSSDREKIESLLTIRGFLLANKTVLKKIQLVSAIVQFLSTFCFDKNEDIRRWTVEALYPLIGSKYSIFIVNRLLKMMDDSSSKVKESIVYHCSRIKKHSLTSYNYIIQQAKIDNNYFVRKCLDNLH